MSRVPIAVLLFVLLLVPGLALAQRRGGGQQPPPQRQETKCDLTVHVVEENDHLLQREVLVELQTGSGSTIQRIFTNDRGEASFSQLDPGSYRIVVNDTQVEPQQMPAAFTIFSMEGAHTEYVHVKLKPSAADAKRSTPPGPAVSAAELNVPEKARKEFDKGNDLMRDNKPEQARAHYEKAIQIYPNYAAAFNNLGVIWVRANDLAKASDAFTRALAADPQYSNAAMNLARLIYKDHDWPRLEDLLKRAIVGEPQNAEALTMLAITEYSLKKWPDAVAYAERVHTLPHGNYAVVHFLAARCLVSLNKPLDAIAEYKIFLKEAPNSASAPEAQQELARLQEH